VSASQENYEAAGYIDLRDVIAWLWSGRWWITASIALFGGAFAAVALFSTPSYRASVVLISASADRAGLGNALTTALGSLSGLATLAGYNIGADASDTEEALAVLRSREFTEAFIRDKNLMPVLFEDDWDARSGTWRSGVEPPTPAKAYKYFDKKVRSIERDRRTGLITVHIEWRDRDQAAEWANALVARLNAEMRSRAIEKANASVGFLEKELLTTSVVATREAIHRLIEAQVRQRMLANVTQEYAFRIVDKAMAPDADDPARPRKLLLLAAGPCVGAVVGVAGVLLFGWGSLILGAVRRRG
jgi:uncharacterized protein involved in exopolysaccharide biosynthesis